MSLFIGIDSGTQSTKAVVLDLAARRVIAEAQAPHELIGGLPAGYAEQHPRDWTAALDQVLTAVGERIDRSRVRGIGVSGQQHGFVPLDAQGKVVLGALKNLGNDNVEEVRIGKYIELTVADGSDMETQVDEMCRTLLSNPVIENYQFEVLP